MESELEEVIKICRDPDRMIEALVNWNLIPSVGTYACPMCGSMLRLGKTISPNRYVDVSVNKSIFYYT